MSSIFFSKRLHLKKKSRGERVRPKTFESEEKAKAYAKEKGIEKFSVEQKGKKFVVCSE